MPKSPGAAREPMPSENLSDGIFDALTVYRRRAGVRKYPNRHS
ncbi:hypothetical protein NEIPOLOT_00369 [Neisseria polysaccharea ATCC 43768]|nr:hypothetical protein NEIPOLOT_00369 [Neisseria polysaccharea ATCC 43768]